jgi:hypothetical protein
VRRAYGLPAEPPRDHRDGGARTAPAGNDDGIGLIQKRDRRPAERSGVPGTERPGFDPCDDATHSVRPRLGTR